MNNITDIIYGKSDLRNVVSIDPHYGNMRVYFNDGSTEIIQNRMYILLENEYPGAIKLQGDLHYKYMIVLFNRTAYFSALRHLKQSGLDYYVIYNDAEAFMTLTGITSFKDLKFEELSVLSFDLETTGISLNDESKVLLIANTFRNKDGKTKKQFCEDDYESQTAMIEDWCKWVRSQNPSILLGHNIFGFDLPYLAHCSKRPLKLGRDGSAMYIESYVRRFRKDGSQSYDFQDVKIVGRQIIDTFFLAIKYDVGRKYESYALKRIIQQENLERDGRQHYDASKIGRNWNIPEERAKIKIYAKDDADDALALFDLMMPSFFYYARSVPKTLQQINNSATGSQINSILVRSYLQSGHSVPCASLAEKYEGAISFGNAGLYRDVMKVDVASLYPSIIRTYKIFDEVKDPKQHFLKMVDYFTDQRLLNKQKAKDTGDRYYKDIEQAQKIVINSAYGLMGATGLNFNSPKNAALITEYGREILQAGMEWVFNKDYQLVNVDTDSFSYTKNRHVSAEEFQADLSEINAASPDGIIWEDDGYFENILVVKAKNYVLKQNGKIKYKGSAFKDQKKEPALSEMMRKFVEALFDDKEHEILDMYHEYVKEILNVTDISRWATKKTVTHAVLKNDRLTEKKVRDALGNMHVQQGDKVYLYPAIDGEIVHKLNGEPVYLKNGKRKMKPNRVLRLVSDFENDADTKHLLKRLYDTAIIMQNVIDKSMFLNYSLKKNEKILKELYK